MARKKKLTSEQIDEIRVKARDTTQKNLAIEYGVSTFVISQIVNHKGSYSRGDLVEQAAQYPDGEV